MSIHLLARGVYDHPVEKVVQARIEKLHKQKESFINMENITSGKGLLPHSIFLSYE